jgi:APA family basic amino acid/polyamine antiporter
MAWGFPATPIVYLVLTLWTLIYLAMDRPTEAGVAFLLIAIGGVLYAVTGRAEREVGI